MAATDPAPIGPPRQRTLPRPRRLSTFPTPHAPVAGDLLWRISPPGDIWSPGRAAGRWHRAGEPMVYAAMTPALAALEALAQRDGSDARAPLRLACIEAPDAGWELLDLDAQQLQDQALTREIGSAWLRDGSALLLFVPSALVPHAYNVLVNAAHPRWQPQLLRCGEEPYRFDERLM